MSFWIAGAIIVGSAVSAVSASKSAKKARKQTEALSLRKENAVKKQKSEADKKKKQTAMRLQKRRGVAQAGRSKTRDTIKTGALGAVGRASGADGKKLIGE